MKLAHAVTTMVMALALAGACSSKPSAGETTPDNQADPAPDTTASQPATVEAVVAEWMRLARDAAEAMLAAQTCDGRASAMDSWLGAHRAELEAMTADLAALPREEVDAEMGRHIEPHRDLQARMEQAREGCEEHEGFAMAWKRISDAMEPSGEVDTGSSGDPTPPE